VERGESTSVSGVGRAEAGDLVAIRSSLPGRLEITPPYGCSDMPCGCPPDIGKQGCRCTRRKYIICTATSADHGASHQCICTSLGSPSSQIQVSPHEQYRVSCGFAITTSNLHDEAQPTAGSRAAKRTPPRPLSTAHRHRSRLWFAGFQVARQVFQGQRLPKLSSRSASSCRRPLRCPAARARPCDHCDRLRQSRPKEPRAAGCAFLPSEHPCTPPIPPAVLILAPRARGTPRRTHSAQSAACAL